MRSLAGLKRELSLRRLATVVGLCTIVSTEMLAQPGLLDYWNVAAVFRGWLHFFIEVLLCGLAMWIAVTYAAVAFPQGRSRDLAVAFAALAGAATGYAIALVWLQPKGFYPPALHMAGDILRWALFGAVIALAHLHVRRAAASAALLDTARIEGARLSRQMVEAQLQVLQAQIEPHFLFNTLAHVKRLHTVAPETAGEMLTSLRHYLRAALPQMRERGSTIARETGLVDAYLRVLRIRMGSRLDFAIDVPESLGDHPFPPMMLITLVENAIKHGLQPQPEGGVIRIAARREGARVEMSVSDTGAGFRGQLGAGVGLANIRGRLRGIYGDGAVLALAPNAPRGVVARIRIPVEVA